MLVIMGWLLVLGTLHPAPAFAIAQSLEPIRRQQSAGRISVWVDREQPYHRGDGVKISFRTEQPGYVTILRVDTDGRIRALFPRDPWRRSYVRGGRTLEVADTRHRPSFLIDDGPGIGFLLAITSPRPFDYDQVTRGDYWDYRMIDEGRIRGDPYVALTDIARRMAPNGGYSYDIGQYYVERRYDYPRFVCYDCHSYARYDDWDPYAASCVRYRVVIYDHPAYYPYRYNQGRNVVVSRPLRPAPRYVFKDAQPGVEYVTRLRQRENEQARRSRVDRGRTSADVGGRGAVPAPAVAPADRLPPRAREERGPVLRRELAEPPKEPTRTGKPEVKRPDTRKVPPVQRGARDPQSTGEPELRRRKP